MRKIQDLLRHSYSEFEQRLLSFTALKYILLDVLVCSVAKYFLRVVPYVDESAGRVKNRAQLIKILSDTAHQNV